MSRRFLKDTAIEYQCRWQAVHGAEIDEIRQTPVATKLRQLSLLIGSRNLFPPLAPQDIEVLDRWNRLRTIYGDTSSKRDY